MRSRRYFAENYFVALHARAVLGLPIPNIAFHGPSASKAVVVEGESQDIVFSGLEEALNIPDTSMRIFAKPEVSGHRRMAVLLARGNSVEEARQKVQEMAKKIKIQI